MIYYHVSSCVSEKQLLTRETKKHRCYCEYICSCDSVDYEKYKNDYNEFLKNKIDQNTGRDAAKWICEAVFEGVRKKCFPEKPSRVWGIYLSNSYENAIKFLNNYRDPETAHIYEVNIKFKILGFDMSFFTKADERIRKESFSFASYQHAIDLAKDYWNECVQNEMDEYIVDDEIIIGPRVY